MAKRCFYCSTEIDSNSVVDMCYKCMYQVWGEKMTQTIIANMEREKIAGNLELGQVSRTKAIDIKKDTKSLPHPSPSHKSFSTATPPSSFQSSSQIAIPPSLKHPSPSPQSPSITSSPSSPLSIEDIEIENLY